MERTSEGGGVAAGFLPDVPPLAESLAHDMERMIGEGEPLAHVVRLLAGDGPTAQQAIGAIGLAAAAWRTHRAETSAGTILAGDALLTRALELGATLPDSRCRRAYLTYVTRAVSASDGGGKFLLGAAIEMGATIGGWTLEGAEGTPVGALAELVRSAGGPLITPHETERPPAPLQARWADMLASRELSEWR